MSMYHHMLVGLDLSEPNADVILEHARRLADPDEIEVVHVSEQIHTRYEKYPPNQGFPDSDALNNAIEKEADEQLERFCKPFGISRHRVLGGNLARVLHDEGGQDVDVVVVGTHGRHGWRLLLGSTPNAVVHGTPRDVLAVRVGDEAEHSSDPYRRILVAIDLTEDSGPLLEHAKQVNESTGAEIVLCHVLGALDGAENERTAFAKLTELVSANGIHDYGLVIKRGLFGPVIHKLAEERDIDLIIVGTHGKHGAELVTGSSANAVLHGASCDALAVRL